MCKPFKIMQYSEMLGESFCNMVMSHTKNFQFFLRVKLCKEHKLLSVVFYHRAGHYVLYIMFTFRCNWMDFITIFDV